MSLELTYQGVQYLLQGSGGATITVTAGSVAVTSITLTGVGLKTVTTNSTTSTCTPGTAKCTAIAITFGGGLGGPLTAGTISGAGFSTGSVVTLTGVGAVSAFGCTAPFAALNNKSITIADWSLLF